MTKEEIFKSGFVVAFINDYFEEKIHSYYPDKDRLLYILSENDKEKQQVTKDKIKSIKSEITDLGFEDLSLTYLLSCKSELKHHFIEPSKRFEFWLNRFAEEFEYEIEELNPITKAICLFNKIPELTVEAINNECDFWETYPNSQTPKIQDFVVIIPSEAEILALIEYTIEEYHKNEYWEFNFEEYKKYIELSKPIELLFNLSELLVQLNRLEMFKDFLNTENEPPQQIISSNPQLNASDLSEKINEHFGFFLRNCPRKSKQILKERDYNKLIKWTIFYFENDFKLPEIAEPIKVVNTNKTFVQLAFKYLFKELHKSNTFPKSLFELYKNAFEPYSEDKKETFDKVKNNDAVKQLMKIDY
jgi:hypothetical protein